MYTSFSSQCVTTPVPLQQYLCSCRALAEQPLQIHSCLLYCDAEIQPKQGQSDVAWRTEVVWKPRSPFLCTVQCLSDCLANLDYQRPGDTHFAGLSNILSKILMTGLCVFVPSSEIFLTKFRFWVYRCHLILLYMSVCSILFYATLCMCTTDNVSVYHCRYSYWQFECCISS